MTTNAVARPVNRSSIAALAISVLILAGLVLATILGLTHTLESVERAIAPEAAAADAPAVTASND